MFGTEVASLFGTLDLQDNATKTLAGFSGGLDQAADKLKSIGSGLISTGASLTAVTAPILGFLGTSLKAASDQQAGLSQLQAVLKSTTGAAGVTEQGAIDLSKSLAGVTRFSHNAVLGAEDMLLTFTSIGKDVFPDATKTALDMSQALGQDLKTSSIELGKALNDPISGLTALHRVGVQFTSAQEDQIKALVKSNDLMGAQKIILGELSREFGGSAVAAAGTFAGKMDILNHKFQDFQEKIGNIIMPILGKLTDAISPILDKISAWVDKNPQLAQTLVVIAGIAAVAGPALVVMGVALSSLGTILGAFAEGGAIAELAAFVPTILPIVAAVGLLAAAWSSDFGGIRETAAKVFDDVKRIVGDVVDWFKTAWNNLQPTLSMLSNWFTNQLLPAVSDTFYGYVLPAIQQFGKTLGDLWALVSPGLSQLANWFLNDALPSILTFISGTVLPVFEKLIAAAQGIWSDVSPYLEKFAAWFTTDGVPAFINFVNGFGVNLNDLLFKAQYIFGSVRDSITGAFNTVKTVVNIVLSELEKFFYDKIQTPLQQIGLLIGVWLQPVSDWFNINIPLAVATAQKVFDDIQTFLKNLWTVVQPFVQPIVTWFQNAATTISNFFTPVFTTIQNVIDKALAAIAIVGKLTGADNSSNGGIGGLLTGATGGGGDTGPSDLEQLIATITGKTGVSNPLASAAGTVGAIIGTAIRPYVESRGSGSPLPAITAPSAWGGARRALGGPVQAGMSYLVGERGAERFTPSQSGTITPNNRLSAGGVQFRDIVVNAPHLNNLDDPRQVERFKEIVVDTLVEVFEAH